MKPQIGRPPGALNSSEPHSNPYKVLALEVIRQAATEGDWKWLKGARPLELSMFCATAGIEMSELQKSAKELEKEQRRKMKYETNTKIERNRAIIEYRKLHPEMTLESIGERFGGLSKQRISQIVRNGLRWVDNNTSTV